MAHVQELNSTISGSSGVATAFRHFSQVVCLAVLLIPAALSAESIDSRAYRLAPGDRITVTVFGQPELSGDVLIDDTGAITIPLTDPIEVKEQIRNHVRRRRQGSLNVENL